MRATTMVAGMVLGLVCAASADEVYRSTGPRGVPTYGNVPTAGARPTGIRSAEPVRTPVADPEATGQGDEIVGTGDGWYEDAPRAADETPAAEPVAAQRTSRASAAERRELAALQRRLDRIDAQLAALGRARTSRAAGTPETGGVGTNAADMVSPEEEALAAERATLEKQITGLGSTAER